MPDNNIAAQKVAKRKELQSARKTAAVLHVTAAQDIIRQFHLSPIGKTRHDWRGVAVAGYLPIASEIDILPLMAELRARGAQIAMPAIIDTNEPLEFRLWDETTPLIEESFGTKAPHREAPTCVPDFICAPLLGFDAEAYRLGYGGGFYDRTLEAVRRQKPITAVGFAYDEQKLDNLPKDSHDLRLDAVITPSLFYMAPMTPNDT